MLGQHFMAAVALLTTALTVLTGHDSPHKWLMIIEAVLAVGLIIALILEYLHIHKGRHSPFPWVDLMAGLVLSMESLNKYFEGRTRLAVAWLFVALLTIAIGFLRPRFSFFRSRIMPKPRIVVDSAGIDVRMSLWSRFRLEWDAIAVVEYSPAAIRIIPEQGHPRSIDLGSIMHPEELASQFSAAVNRLNLPPDKFQGFPS